MEKERKGRGSFVDIRRKSLTFSNIFQDDQKEEENTNVPKHSIETYLESLKKEKQDWKDILNQRKMSKKSCEDKYKFDHLIIKKEDIEKHIPPEYKDFLENKPSYLEFAELVKKYVHAVHYITNYKSDIINYYNKACNELEINQKLFVENMCCNALCDICNTENCQIPDHRFHL